MIYRATPETVPSEEQKGIFNTTGRSFAGGLDTVVFRRDRWAGARRAAHEQVAEIERGQKETGLTYGRAVAALSIRSECGGVLPTGHLYIVQEDVGAIAVARSAVYLKICQNGLAPSQRESREDTSTQL